MVVLEATLEVSQNTSDKLLPVFDSLHQYSRRNYIIVSGIPIKDEESSASLKGSIERNVLKNVRVSREFFEYEFDKIHRIEAADGS